MVKIPTQYQPLPVHSHVEVYFQAYVWCIGCRSRQKPEASLDDKCQAEHNIAASYFHTWHFGCLRSLAIEQKSQTAAKTS